jgi:hypothetical protein
MTIKAKAALSFTSASIVLLGCLMFKSHCSSVFLNSNADLTNDKIKGWTIPGFEENCGYLNYSDRLGLPDQ